MGCICSVFDGSQLVWRAAIGWGLGIYQTARHTQQYHRKAESGKPIGHVAAPHVLRTYRAGKRSLCGMTIPHM